MPGEESETHHEGIAAECRMTRDVRARVRERDIKAWGPSGALPADRGERGATHRVERRATAGRQAVRGPEGCRRVIGGSAQQRRIWTRAGLRDPECEECCRATSVAQSWRSGDEEGMPACTGGEAVELPALWRCWSVTSPSTPSSGVLGPDPSNTDTDGE